jgi:hypothetical protein
MERHSADTANVFVYYRFLKKVRSTPPHYVHGSVVRPGDGIFTVQLNCPRTLDAIALEKLIRRCWAKVELGYGRILVRDCADAGWINYMLKDRQKSEFDGFVDSIIVDGVIANH